MKAPGRERETVCRQIAALFLLLLFLAGCSGAPAASTPRPSPTTAVATPLAGDDAIAFLEQQPGTVRVMSFNPYWDSIFGDEIGADRFAGHYDKAAAFRRIAAATAPDIFCLQEVAPARESAELVAILDEVLPLEGDVSWRVQRGEDSVIASRFPLSLRAADKIYQGSGYSLGHAMALADLPDADFAQDLYLVCAHFRSQGGASDIALRQQQADAIVAWLADARTPGGEVDLPAGTPFVVLGDFNVYDTDPAHHLTTLLTGDIEDEARYGEDAPPDWDGSSLADVLPTHNAGGGATYTWRDDRQPFNPGELDRILYSDSALELVHSFVLNTAALDAAALQAARLEAADVALDLAQGNYDHLPLVADFREP